MVKKLTQQMLDDMVLRELGVGEAEGKEGKIRRAKDKLLEIARIKKAGEAK